MDEPVNDQAGPNSFAPPAAKEPTPKEQLEAIVEQQLRSILGVMFRGMMVSTNVPPHILLPVAARVWGGLSATAIAGELAAVVNIRKDLRDYFMKAVKDAPITQLPTPAGSTSPAELSKIIRG